MDVPVSFLECEVAIKFLPRQIATSDEERERFKIEAQAAAALNHPNIATIYEIDEADGQMFDVPRVLFLRYLAEWAEPSGTSLQRGDNGACQARGRDELVWGLKRKVQGGAM